MSSIVSAGEAGGKAKLLDRVREAIRLKHYSLRTEHAYVDWIKRFIIFHGKQHPEVLGAEAVRAFLSDLASTRNVAASTQNQAFSALLFLYREVLKQELPWIDDIERVKRPPKIPVVFTPEEARAVLSKLQGTARLMAHLLYGSGLRLMARKSFAHVPRNAMTGPCFMSTCFIQQRIMASTSAIRRT